MDAQANRKRAREEDNEGDIRVSPTPPKKPPTAVTITRESMAVELAAAAEVLAAAAEREVDAEIQFDAIIGDLKELFSDREEMRKCVKLRNAYKDARKLVYLRRHKDKRIDAKVLNNSADQAWSRFLNKCFTRLKENVPHTGAAAAAAH